MGIRIRTILVPLILLGGIAIPVAANSPPAAADTISGYSLVAGHSLTAGNNIYSAPPAQSIFSQYELDMQTDGNLVVYGNTHAVSWASGTNGTGSHNRLTMQTDGNLVIYNSVGKALWASNTRGTGNANHLAMQDDGNAVVYTSSGKAVWASGAANSDRLDKTTTSYYGELDSGQYLHSYSGRYRATMQVEGNLTVSDNGKQLWSSDTARLMQPPAGLLTGNWLVLRTDGNLVMETGPASVIWSTHTSSGSYLVMQDDGNLVLYTSTGKAVWASNTVTNPGGAGAPSKNVILATIGGAAGVGYAHSTYGYPYTAPSNKADKWNFIIGQCVSWDAYRLNQLNNIPGGFYNTRNGVSRYWSNAINWDDAARRAGFVRDGNPALGSVGWYNWSPNGHVAYVEKVNSPTSVVISEMNWDGHNGFRVRVVTKGKVGWPMKFLHIHDRG